MSPYKEGDNSSGICYICKNIVTTTFMIREFSLCGNDDIHKVLVAVCDGCDNLVAIPHRSVEQIREEKEKV